MIRICCLALAAFFLAAALAGCDTNEQQDEFFLESDLPPNGYTSTNEAGEVLDEDPDDWRVAPAFRGAVEVEPAFPNPVERNGLVSLFVEDRFGDAIIGGVFVSGRVNNDPGQFVRLATDDSAGPVYVLTFNPTELRVTAGDDAQLFRVRVFTNDSRLITYGDILVQ